MTSFSTNHWVCDFLKLQKQSQSTWKSIFSFLIQPTYIDFWPQKFHNIENLHFVTVITKFIDFTNLKTKWKVINLHVGTLFFHLRNRKYVKCKKCHRQAGSAARIEVHNLNCSEKRLWSSSCYKPLPNSNSHKHPSIEIQVDIITSCFQVDDRPDLLPSVATGKM